MRRKLKGEIMKEFGRFMAFIVGLVISAFAYFSLWKWFIVPLGVIQISPLHVLGVKLFLNSSRTPNREETEEEKDYGAVKAIVAPLLVWGIGWIYFSFM